MPTPRVPQDTLHSPYNSIIQIELICKESNILSWKTVSNFTTDAALPQVDVGDDLPWTYPDNIERCDDALRHDINSTRIFLRMDSIASESLSLSDRPSIVVSDRNADRRRRRLQ